MILAMFPTTEPTLEMLTLSIWEANFSKVSPTTFPIPFRVSVHFGESVTKPLVEAFGDTDYRYGRASHGYLPEKGPHPVFMAKGPDFAENVVLEKGRLIDEAPTYAALLGVNLPDTDGEPIKEFLRK